MKFGFLTFSINANFSTKQYGHMSQVDLINTYQDDLHARLTYLENDQKTIIHLSFDLLAFFAPLQQQLQTLMRQYFNNENLYLITSATHTHYANDIRNIQYQEYLVDLIMKQLDYLVIHEYDHLMVSYQNIHFNDIGTSRITNYESNLEYLTLIKIYHHDDVLLHFIIHNTHPTVLDANVPYFSSEFCGNALIQLSKLYPNSNFTYVSGAMGDISTRFTRDDQSYESMLKIAQRLVNKVSELTKIKVKKYPLTLHYEQYHFPFEHDFKEIDLTNLSSNLHPRELLSLEYGKIIRNQTKANNDVISDIIVVKLSLAHFDLVFIPNEIFSQYLNYFDVDHQMLIAYSNGYGPYITPLNFKYLCYEVFCDTLSDQCKQRLIDLFKSI